MARDEEIQKRTVAEAIRQAKLLFGTKVGHASSTQSGLVPVSPGDATKYLNGAAPPVFASVRDTDLSLSDNTTNNVSVAEHGFVPKAPNDATKFLDGTGSYSTPAGGGTPEPSFPTLSIAPLVRLSAAHSTITKSAGLVTAVSDLSGNGHTATSTSGILPRYLSRSFNHGRPGLWFDGTARLILAGLGAIAQPWSVVVVCQNLEVAASDGNIYRDDTAGSTGYLSGGNTWSIFAGAAFTSAALFTQNRTLLPSVGPTTGLPACRIDIANGASSVISNNGVEVTGNPGAGGLTTSSSSLYVGGLKASVGATNVKMMLFEFLIFTGALTSGDRALLNTYYASSATAGVDL